MEDGIITEMRVVVQNRAGLHARPAGEFVKLAGRFGAEIELEKDGVQVNGKSILGVMMLAAEQGSELVIRCRGTDAESAAEALVALVARGFGEG